MLLSIITINLNNSTGLQRTVRSVLSQTNKYFEYIVIDGNSTDESITVIEEYSEGFGGRMKWISESDDGIYNAMNKGIHMASGEYVQFLNSGDCLASDDATERMVKALKENNYPGIIYGNMVKEMPNGHMMRDRCFAGQDISLLGFYIGTLNHSPAYIRKSLFEKYGLYDDSLRIVSDWKWFMKAIVFGDEKPVYNDIDVTVFDMHGISETNKDLDKKERKQVLNDVLPYTILKDYEQWAFSIEQIKRLKRHPWAYKIVWFIERCLFKLEKLRRKRTQETLFQ